MNEFLEDYCLFIIFSTIIIVFFNLVDIIFTADIFWNTIVFSLVMIIVVIAVLVFKKYKSYKKQQKLICNTPLDKLVEINIANKNEDSNDSYSYSKDDNITKLINKYDKLTSKKLK